MSSLYLVRIPFDPVRLLGFAFANGITHEDETFGYTLHAWLVALFGDKAPKPFRYFEHRRELLAYAAHSAADLLEHAQAFASPAAWSALEAEGVMSKPMPTSWRAGQRLHLEVLTCPVSRKEGEEKDVYLRTLDRLGDKAPARAEVYRAWFTRQWRGCVRFEHVELLGMRARSRLLRRARNGANRLRMVERPQALFAADVEIADAHHFGAALRRGIGRHRTFGFGMVLVGPPR